ncbi:MAG: hypothetical protein AB7F43_00115 [Bacteriovoracia bacterium]
MRLRVKIIVFTLFLLLLLPTLAEAKGGWFNQQSKPRLSLFIGMDISGSFMRGKYFDDSVNFLAHYIYAHLHGLGGLDVPAVLFISSIGGDKPNEPKTFYPIQAFEHKSVDEIRAKLKEIFPKKKENPFTDYNSFFKHVAETVRDKKLVLRPVTIVLISDGQPDFPDRKNDYRRIQLLPLENLSRNITIRLLYTSAEVGSRWTSKIPRRRVKIWTQDAEAMVLWKDPNILLPGKSIEQQTRFLEWAKDNVDFGVRGKRVD